jgi:DNA-binding FrmR family transcriptional regulator
VLGGSSIFFVIDLSDETEKATFTFPAYSYTIGGYSTVNKKMHTVEEKPKLILRIKRIKGQIAAIERALEADEDCSDLLQLITAARGAMNGLMAELLEGHIRFHVIDPKQKISSEQALAADELIDIVRSYLK